MAGFRSDSTVPDPQGAAVTGGDVARSSPDSLAAPCLGTAALPAQSGAPSDPRPPAPAELLRLVQALSAAGPELASFTERLVRINSHSHNVRGVNEVGALLADGFSLPGLQLTTKPGGEGVGDHLVWTTDAFARGRGILLIGHHDTVFPPGSFEGWRSEGSRAFGPGCFDMKGGLAVIWGALRVLSHAGLLGELPLAFMSVADEEVGSRDSRAHLTALAGGARVALVFESGRPGDAIVTRRRGVGSLQVLVRGKAAHAGNAPTEGASAIWTLARFIDRAQALSDHARGCTVNVGTVQGGTSSNTVPASAQASVDLRFETHTEGQALLIALHELARAVALPGTRVELAGDLNRPPLEKTEASMRLFEQYAECQRAAGLGSGEYPIVGGGSDANTVAALGVPAIDGLGPRGGGFHTPEEWVDLASLVPKAESLLRFLYDCRFT